MIETLRGGASALNDQPTPAIGRSGRRYAATRLADAAPVSGESALFALLLNGVWGWVGSAEDLIGNPESRTRFRALSVGGAVLYGLGQLADPLERMTVAWDLEGTGAFARRHAA